ncbi:MAG TPA: hypothetical protein VM580_13750, partial [Labilithrix sp.]|nr:hypothetical protein [Labilithrix sp.]
MAEGPEHNVAPLPREHDEGARPGTRSDYESVDFEVVEELGIDVEFEDASVQKILAMTGEDWSLDEQRETLKEAAKNRRAKAGDDEPSSRPSLHIPTPYDLGGSSPGQRGPTSGAAAPSGEEARPAIPRMATRAVPRPLASTPPSGPPKPRSVPPPPLPPNRGSAQPPARGSVKPSPPQAPLPSRRPPPLPKAENATGSKVPPAPPPTVDVPRTTPEGHALVELLTARIDRLAEMGDRVGLARARLELSIVHETLGDDARVNAELEAALDADPDLGPAHAGLRRRVQSSSADPTSYRTQASTMLRHLERELAGASGDTAIVELLVERARLLGASDRPEEAHAAWELVLGRSPHHAAALKGFESALSRSVFVRAPGKDAFIPTTDDERWENLVAHLGRMADSYSAQPNLAAWLHVERARERLSQRRRDPDKTPGFERALRLDGSVGPVRDAFTLHCAAHHDSARLAALFAEEARLETTPARCAELELDAATLAHSVLDDDATAVALLESAAARAPTTPSVDRRVLDDLVRLYEVSGQWPEAARTRRNRLRFFTDVSAQTYELVRLSAIEEKLGNLDNATADVLRALELDPGDATLVDEVDRLLAASGKDDERIALWHREAQRAEEGPKRARALAKAAHLAEGRGQLDEAIRHLRAAWVAAPGDSEILDALSRLMSPTPTEGFDREVRALIELYSQAAQATPDTGRRVAYLEKVATLWEELVGDPVRAARTFEEILRLEPDRRVAVLGLERTAARIGDDRALSRALEAEARLAEDGVDVLALRVRAAQTLARVDPLRATHLVHEVLELDPEHMGGRNLETRLHAEAGRWELAAQSIRARLGIAVTTKDKVALWLELAQIYDARLRDPKAAVEALEEARKVDPSHPVPPEEIARVLEAAGDAKALRIALERLARDAITPEERARHLTLAAEIDELRLQDISSAAALYRRALAETPDDGFIADRLVRVLARHAAMSEKPGRACLYTAAFDEFLAELGKRAEKAKSSGRAHACSFQLASLLVTTNRDLYRARALLDAIHEADPRHTGALRLLEYVARRDSNPQKVAHAVKQQADRFDDVRARLGALWELASLEAWVLPGGEAVGTYTRILELDPTDASALAAAVRLALLPSRHGEAPARRAAIAALRALSALAHDEATRIATDLRLALILETHAMDPATERETSTSAAREALERLRAALALDPLSVTAATTLARLANRLDDASGAAAAALSLAELSVQPKVRAKYLIDAANLLLGDSSEEALGPMEERTERAAALLEKALEAD